MPPPMPPPMPPAMLPSMLPARAAARRTRTLILSGRRHLNSKAMMTTRPTPSLLGPYSAQPLRLLGRPMAAWQPALGGRQRHGQMPPPPLPLLPPPPSAFALGRDPPILRAITTPMSASLGYWPARSSTPRGSSSLVQAASRRCVIPTGWAARVGPGSTLSARRPCGAAPSPLCMGWCISVLMPTARAQCLATSWFATTPPDQPTAPYPPIRCLRSSVSAPR